jgi:serine/threonine protein kinase
LADVSKENQKRFSVQWRQTYLDYFLPPRQLRVYANGALLVMDYANMGTLNDFVNLLITNRIVLPKEEHEVIVAYFALQMLRAVKLLHANLSIIHGDVKSDNWVFSHNTGACSNGDINTCNSPKSLNELVQIKLIDFGMSKFLHADQQLLHSIASKNSGRLQTMTHSEVVATDILQGTALQIKFLGNTAPGGLACEEMRRQQYWTTEVSLFYCCVGK